MPTTNPISLPGNAYIRYEDIERFQNGSTKDLILQGVRDDGSVILANRSTFGRVLNWLSSKVLGRADPNAQAVANLFVRQVRGLEHGGQQIVNSLNLGDAKSIRNREIHLVLNALAGEDGNARFRFNNLNPLARRKEESDDLAQTFKSDGEFFAAAFSEAGIESHVASQYDEALQAAFDRYFSENKKAPSTDEGFDLAIDILKQIGTRPAADAQSNPPSETSNQLEESFNSQIDEPFAFVDGPYIEPAKEKVGQSWSEEDEASDTVSETSLPEVPSAIEETKAPQATPEEIQFEQRGSALKEHFNKEKLPTISEETESELTQELAKENEAAKKSKPSSPATVASEVIKQKPVQALDSKTITEIIIPRPYHIREQEVVSAHLFAEKLHSINKYLWEDEAKEYLAELNRIKKETKEPDLVYEIEVAQALFEFKLGLPNSYRQLNKLVNQYQTASPQKYFEQDDGEGENLNDTLYTLAPGKSIDTVYKELQDYKALCESKVKDGQREAAKLAVSSLLKQAKTAYSLHRPYPPLTAVRSELALIYGTLNSLDRFRSEQETKLGYLKREEIFRQAEQVYNDNASNNTLSQDEIGQAIEYLAETGSACELYAGQSVTTEEHKKLENDLRAKIIDLIEKYQVLLT